MSTAAFSSPSRADALTAETDTIEAVMHIDRNKAVSFLVDCFIFSPLFIFLIPLGFILFEH